MPRHVKRKKISMEPVLQDFSVTSLTDFTPGVLGPSDSSIFEQIADYDVELPDMSMNRTEDVNLSSGPFPPDSTKMDLTTSSSGPTLFKKPFNIRPTRKLRPSLFYEDVKDSEPDTPEPEVHRPFQRRTAIPINPEIFNIDSSNDSLDHSNSVSNFVARRKTRMKKVVEVNLFDKDLNSSESDNTFSLPPKLSRRKTKCKTLNSAIFNDVLDNTLNGSLSDSSVYQQLPFKIVKNRQTNADLNVFDSILDSTDSLEHSLNRVLVGEDDEKEQSQLKNVTDIHAKSSMPELEKNSLVNKNKVIVEENETFSIVGTVNNESSTSVNIIKKINALVQKEEENVKKTEVSEKENERNLIKISNFSLNKEEDIETCRINYLSEDENENENKIEKGSQNNDHNSDSDLGHFKEIIGSTLVDCNGQENEVHYSEHLNNNENKISELNQSSTDTPLGNITREISKNSLIKLNEEGIENYITKEPSENKTGNIENWNSSNAEWEKERNELLITRKVVENDKQNTLSCDILENKKTILPGKPFQCSTDFNVEDDSINHHDCEKNNESETVHPNLETSNRNSFMNIIKIAEINTSNEIETDRRDKMLSLSGLNVENISFEVLGSQQIRCTPNEKGKRVSFMLGNDKLMIGDINQEINGTPNEKEKRVSFKSGNNKTRKSIRKSSITNNSFLRSHSTSKINISQNSKSVFSLDSLIIETPSVSKTPDSVFIDLHPSKIKSTSGSLDVESNISQCRTPNETTIINTSHITSRSEDSDDHPEESVFTASEQSTLEREMLADNLEEQESVQHEEDLEEESNHEYVAMKSVADEEDSDSMESEGDGISQNMDCSGFICQEEKESQEYQPDIDQADQLTEQNENLSSISNVKCKKTHDTIVSNSSINFKKPHTLPLDTPNTKRGKIRSNNAFKEPFPVPLSKRKLKEILDRIPISELKTKKKKLSVQNVSREQLLQHEVEESLKKRQGHKTLFTNQSSGKLKKPKKWVSPKLYEFIISKLRCQFGIKSRVRAEKLVLFLVEHVESVLRKENNYYDIVEEMKIELANLKIVITHWDFYEFVTSYFDGDFVEKVYPLQGDQDNPYEPDPFESIL